VRARVSEEMFFFLVFPFFMSTSNCVRRKIPLANSFFFGSGSKWRHGSYSDISIWFFGPVSAWS
jgi:hypothetical protein